MFFRKRNNLMYAHEPPKIQNQIQPDKYVIRREKVIIDIDENSINDIKKKIIDGEIQYNKLKQILYYLTHNVRYNRNTFHNFSKMLEILSASVSKSDECYIQYIKEFMMQPRKYNDEQIQLLHDEFEFKIDFLAKNEYITNFIYDFIKDLSGKKIKKK